MSISFAYCDLITIEQACDHCGHIYISMPYETNSWNCWLIQLVYGNHWATNH